MKIRNKMLILLWLLLLLSYLDRVNFAVAMPTISKDLGLDPSQQGMILSAFFVGYGLLQVAGGMLADKFGSRLTMTFALTWWSVFTALTGMASSLWQMLIIRPLFGAGEAMHPPASWKLISEWFPPKERVRANSLNLCSIALGPALAPPIVVLLMQAYGWHSMFFIFAVPGFILAAVCWVFVRNKPEEYPGMTAGELAEIRAEAPPASATPAAKAEKVSFGEAAKEKNIWVLMLVYLLFGIPFWGFLSWLPSYLVNERGFAMVKMGMTASLPFFTAFAAMLLASTVCKHVFRNNNRLFVATCYTLGAVFMYLAYSSVSPDWCVFFLCLCAGIGMFMPFGAFWTIPMNSMSPRVMGFSTGVINTGGQIGGFIAPMTIGYLVKSTGSFGAGFLFMEICLVAAAVLIVISSPKKQA